MGFRRFGHECALYVHFSQQIFYCLHKFKKKTIENRQHLVNMKAIGVVVMSESAITFPLPGSRQSSYCSIVGLLIGKAIFRIFQFCAKPPIRIH